jgi:hypothetical protein
MKFDYKLTNSLKSDTQPFGEFTAPRRPVQNIEQTPSAWTRKCATTPNSIRNCLEAATCSPPGEMPTIHLAAPDKSEFLQCFERLCCLLEIKLGLYCNIRLGFLAGSKCDKAGFFGIPSE